MHKVKVIEAPTHFLGIPNDVWRIVMNYLSAQGLAALSRVNRHSKYIIRQDSYWKLKYEQHFPKRFRQLPTENSNWYSLFVKATCEEYKKLPQNIRNLFFIVKEGNTQFLNLSNSRTLDDLLDREDNNNLSPIEWLLLKAHQPMLNQIFNTATDFLQRPPSLFSLRKNRRWVPAHWAVVCNQPEHVISTHTENQYFSNHPVTPLHVAARYGLEEIVKFLLGINKFPIDRQTIDTYGKFSHVMEGRETALHLAAFYGHTKVVKTLLEHNANPAVSVALHIHENETPLHYASSQNHAEAAKLLAIRISPLEEGLSGKCPLEYSMDNNNFELFETFIEVLRQSPDQRQKAIQTLNRILHSGVVNHCSDQYLEPLLMLGAKPNVRVDCPQTAVDIAINERNEKTILLLLGDQASEVSSFDYRPSFVSYSPQIAIFFILGLIIGGIAGCLFPKMFLKAEGDGLPEAISEGIVWGIGIGSALGVSYSLLAYMIERRQGRSFIQNMLAQRQRQVETLTESFSLVPTDETQDLERGDRRALSFSGTYRSVGFLRESNEQESIDLITRPNNLRYGAN